MHKMLLILALNFAFLTACGSQPEKPIDLKPVRFTELYRGDLTKVDALTIRSGSTGEVRTITDKATIARWLDLMKTIRFVPDPNQEPRSGWIYWVALYEGETKVFEFHPNQIHGVYYIPDEQVISSVNELFQYAKKAK